MSIVSKLKRLIKVTDFFYSTQMLRYDAQLQYKTLTGGIISIGIIVTIIIGFASMIMDTLNLSSITSSVQKIRNSVPPPASLEITPQSNFRFAVQLWKFNLSDSVRYFDVTLLAQLTTDINNLTITQIPLEACTYEMFQHVPQIASNFYSLNVSNWLCPPMNTTLNLYGKYSSNHYNMYTVQVSACNNQTDPLRPCARPQEIAALFSERGDFFYFTVYFTNPQINPDKQNYKNFYVQDKSYAIFGKNLGSETYLYFTDYSIQTDYSIWPFTNIQQDSGSIVENLAINHPFQTNINGTYITWNFAKSSDSIIYTRKVQKISSVFSFMGGMIGAISAVLIVVKVYTRLSFQFSIAFQIFEPKEGNNQNSHISVNFCNFIKYYLFTFCRFIDRPCNWPAMKYADECKRQILKQLDIKTLIKRIIFIQHCLTNIVEDYQLTALQMKRPTDPKFVKKIRQKCQSIIQFQIYDEFDSHLGKQSEYQHEKEQNQIQKHPNIGILMIGEQIDRTPQSYLSPSFLQYQRQQVQPANKKDTIYPDNQILGEMKSVSNESKESSINNSQCRIIKKQKFNHILNTNNLYQLQKRRRTSSMLSQLRKHALDGNAISNRIWSQLDRQTKKIIENGQTVFNQ